MRTKMESEGCESNLKALDTLMKGGNMKNADSLS
jgi:hypothetical protein